MTVPVGPGRPSGNPVRHRVTCCSKLIDTHRPSQCDLSYPTLSHESGQKAQTHLIPNLHLNIKHPRRKSSFF